MRIQSSFFVILLMLFGFSVTSCYSISSKDVSGKLSDTITIGINEVYQNKLSNFSLQIDSVLSDSRCPDGLVCVWAGNAEVRMKLMVENSHPILFKLNTLESFGQTIRLYGREFRLLNVLPYPGINNKYCYQSYQVRIYISTTNHH